MSDKTPVGFHELCSGLHQDAMLFACGDIEQLGTDCTRFVRNEHKAGLRVYLRAVLNESTPSEMKRLIKREKRDIQFRRGDRAEAFLRAALKALSGRERGT